MRDASDTSERNDENEKNELTDVCGSRSTGSYGGCS